MHLEGEEHDLHIEKGICTYRYAYIYPYQWTLPDQKEWDANKPWNILWDPMEYPM